MNNHSDTPRTDEMMDRTVDFSSGDFYAAAIELCRELERELNELKRLRQISRDELSRT